MSAFLTSVSGYTILAQTNAAGADMADAANKYFTGTWNN
jgi:hypothetical protein